MSSRDYALPRFSTYSAEDSSINEKDGDPPILADILVHWKDWIRSYMNRIVLKLYFSFKDHDISLLYILLPFFAFCGGLAFVLAVATLDTGLSLMLGQAILKAAGHPGYAASSKFIWTASLVGGSLVYVPLHLVEGVLRSLASQTEDDRRQSSGLLAGILMSVGSAALSSCAGAAILAADMEGRLDPTHAARAGALGAVIITIRPNGPDFGL
ncbi:hypothetical protein JAAARDRAFT_49900 [Jaapia argillacea MUCL 33604]|uniref:Uncharacterized protein n=1 Tax=Jaapia argillacea MUCL 33604 TaxID=933084 RepID=A0A067PH34_9AGAM|nr:hypothetical protein JAAARDRAFT_49900 [Jaapia argillacea MUCL 33604]